MQSSIRLCVNRFGKWHLVHQDETGLFGLDLLAPRHHKLPLITHRQLVEHVVGQAQLFIDVGSELARCLHVEIVSQATVVIGPLVRLLAQDGMRDALLKLRVVHLPPDRPTEVTFVEQRLFRAAC